MIDGDRELSDIQKQLLKAQNFTLDGWCQQSSFDAARDLVRRGLLVVREDGSDEQQYACLHFSITEAGRRLL